MVAVLGDVVLGDGRWTSRKWCPTELNLEVIPTFASPRAACMAWWCCLGAVRTLRIVSVPFFITRCVCLFYRSECLWGLLFFDVMVGVVLLADGWLFI